MNRPPLPPRPLSLILRTPESALHWLCSLLGPKQFEKHSSKLIALLGNNGVVNGYHRKIFNTISYRDLVYNEEQLKVIYDKERHLISIMIYSSMSVLFTINNTILFRLNMLWLLLLCFRYHCLQSIYTEMTTRTYGLYRHLVEKLDQ